MVHGVSLLRNGRLHLVNEDGMPAEAIDPWDIHGTTDAINGDLLFYPNPTALVHGFKYDPAADDRDNPHKRTYPEWRGHIGTPCFGFGWYSVPGGIGGGRSAFRYARSILEAWANGKRSTYKYAWQLAEDTGPVLGVTLDALANPKHGNRPKGFSWDIVCHSLGSRVVLSALLDFPHIPVRRVLFLNGAASCRLARVVAMKRPNVEFFNVVVKSDDVLCRLGKHFSGQGLGGQVIGYDGLTILAPPNWTEFILDSKEVRAWGLNNGFDLQGDNPHSVADHWYSFHYEPNWKLWRYILRGEDLSGIPTTRF